VKLNEVIALYIKLRDKKDALRKEFNKSVEDITAKMDKIEGALAQHFEKVGQTSAKTDAGTAYFKTQVRASVQDRDAFLSFVRDNDMWDFIESKANLTAVQDYLESNEEAPPGVKVTTRRVVNVNRGR